MGMCVPQRCTVGLEPAVLGAAGLMYCDMPAAAMAIDVMRPVAVFGWLCYGGWGQCLA